MPFVQVVLTGSAARPYTGNVRIFDDFSGQTDSCVQSEDPIMGVAFVEGRVKGPSNKTETVKFLIDSGATYSLLPKAVWEAIGLEPKRKLSFILADGTSLERFVSEAFVVLPEGEAHTPVILGEEGDEALLGAVTLEILGLVLNPFDRTLHPMRMLLC